MRWILGLMVIGTILVGCSDGSSGDVGTQDASVDSGPDLDTDADTDTDSDTDADSDTGVLCGGEICHKSVGSFQHARFIPPKSVCSLIEARDVMDQCPGHPRSPLMP